jgi:hypothetical protein
MGFLRKVGRKIKKGVKKLMGGKFGKILGGIGLAMTFMGGANALFGGNPLFEGIKETLGSMNPFKSNSVTEASSKAIEATSEIASSEGLREGAKDMLDLAKQTQADATNYSSKFLTDTKYSDLATVGQKVKKTFIEGKEFLLPEDSTFVGDVTRSVGSTLLLQGVQGEEEQQIRTGQPLQAASYQSPQTTQPLSPMLASTQPLPQQFQTTLTYGTV